MTVGITIGGLADIAEKVAAGARLTQEDGLRLYAARDLHEIGRLANLVRERRHGNVAYYNVNRHINYTNYCVLRCKFCSFYRPYPQRTALDSAALGAEYALQGPAALAAGCSPEPPASSADRRHSCRASMRDVNVAAREHRGSSTTPATGRARTQAATLRPRPQALEPPSDAYELPVERVAELARHAYDDGATEVHIVGGLHPRLPFSYYLDMCRAIRAACPSIHIKAFTAIEIIHFTRIAKPRLSIRAVLEQLRAAGLDSLPGGGAEIFDDRVHDEAFRNKVGAAGWFDVHRAAHELGIPSNATMLYGHVETPAERIAHLLKLREHQDESRHRRRAAFNCFVPLPFIPEGSEFGRLPGPTGLDDLKTLAISRLMLDNVPHLKAFWLMHSPKLAQVALSWGVDDLDGTVVFYDITKREGEPGSRHQELTVDQLRRLIRETGRVPVERDTLYRRVIREESGRQWRVSKGE